MIMRASVRIRFNPTRLQEVCKVAEHELAVKAERDTRPYIPSESGTLRSSGKVVNNYIVWDLPYAKIQYFGKIYVDPIKKVGGFLTPQGWKSRRGVEKIRSNRDFAHTNGEAMWFYKAKMANLEKWFLFAERRLNRG